MGGCCVTCMCPYGAMILLFFAALAIGGGLASAGYGFYRGGKALYLHFAGYNSCYERKWAGQVELEFRGFSYPRDPNSVFNEACYFVGWHYKNPRECFRSAELFVDGTDRLRYRIHMVSGAVEPHMEKPIHFERPIDRPFKFMELYFRSEDNIWFSRKIFLNIEIGGSDMRAGAKAIVDWPPGAICHMHQNNGQGPRACFDITGNITMTVKDVKIVTVEYEKPEAGCPPTHEKDYDPNQTEPARVLEMCDRENRNNLHRSRNMRVSLECQAMVYGNRFPALPPVPDVPFTQYLLEQCKLYGDRVAIDDPDLGPLITFKQITERLEDVDRRLAVYNIGHGDVIATIAGNTLDYILLVIGALNRGITIVPINPAMKKLEIEKYLEGVHCILAQKEYIDKAWETTLDMDNPVKMIVELDHFFAIDTSEVEVQKRQETQFDTETTAFVFYSSGTTGPPKGICIPHRAVIAHCLIGHLMYAQPPGERMPLPEEASIIHGVLPLFHAGGLITMFIMLSRGMTVVLNGKFESEKFIQILIEKEVSVVYLVPAALPVLLELPPNIELPALKLVYIGAAPVTKEDASAFAERWPDVKLVQMYGLTEAGALIFATHEGEDPSNAGMPMPGVQFKILAEDGSECPPEVPGDIVVKTATMASGYLKGEKFGEWFETGDVGSVDAKGALTIVGRTKEMIKVRGWQVNPYELENAIKHGVEGVEECAIVGVDMGGSTLPHAFIVGNPNVNEVIRFVRENFVSYKHLAGVSLVTELPKTATGKLKRVDLVQTTTVDDADVFPLPNTRDDEDNAEMIVIPSIHASMNPLPPMEGAREEEQQEEDKVEAEVHTVEETV